MLCETHKDILYKSAARALALGGIALVSLGATIARPPLSNGPAPVATPGVAAPAFKPIVVPVPKSKAQLATARIKPVRASTARATVSLYEHSVRRSTLRGQGCEAAERGV